MQMIKLAKRGLCLFTRKPLPLLLRDKMMFTAHTGGSRNTSKVGATCIPGLARALLPWFASLWQGSPPGSGSVVALAKPRAPQRKQ